MRFQLILVLVFLAFSSILSEDIKVESIYSYKENDYRRHVVRIENISNETIYMVKNKMSIWLENYYSPAYGIFGNKLRKTSWNENDAGLDITDSGISYPEYFVLKPNNSFNVIINLRGETNILPDEMMFDLVYISASKRNTIFGYNTQKHDSQENTLIIDLTSNCSIDSIIYIPKIEPALYMYTNSGKEINKSNDDTGLKYDVAKYTSSHSTVSIKLLNK